jgi:hypothetical protein
MNVVVGLEKWISRKSFILSAPCASSEVHSAAPDHSSTCTPSEIKIKCLHTKK